jgi:hypothetical protein
MILCASNIYYKPNTYDVLTVSMESEHMLGRGPFRIPRAVVRKAICDDEGEITEENKEFVAMTIKMDAENSLLKENIKKWRDRIGKMIEKPTPSLRRESPAVPDPSAWLEPERVA